MNAKSNFMKINVRLILFTLMIGLMIPLAACEKDDDGPDGSNNNNNNPETGSGSADINITGDLNTNLTDYATWEITDDPLLRLRLGNEFAPNIVINYRLGSNDVNDLLPGTYTAVSATFTGQPADEMAFQYNGDDTGFPESGTVTISSVSGQVIEGETDVTISFFNGDTAVISGIFAAEPG